MDPRGAGGGQGLNSSLVPLFFQNAQVDSRNYNIHRNKRVPWLKTQARPHHKSKYPTIALKSPCRQRQGWTTSHRTYMPLSLATHLHIQLSSQCQPAETTHEFRFRWPPQPASTLTSLSASHMSLCLHFIYPFRNSSEQRRLGGISETFRVWKVVLFMILSAYFPQHDDSRLLLAHHWLLLPAYILPSPYCLYSNSCPHSRGSGHLWLSSALAWRTGNHGGVSYCFSPIYVGCTHFIYHVHCTLVPSRYIERFA